VILVINSIPSVSANTVAPFAPLGRQQVGQESTELKSSSFKALEQSSDSARSENRQSPDYRPNQDAERDRVNSSGSPVQARQKSQQNGKQEQELKDKKVVDELAARDREVRAHEQAHAAVGGQYAGSPTYSFVRGPDGIGYAVGGEVSIDTSPVPNDPEATIRKAQVIRAAASAPAEPSPQDRRVAVQAASLENEARAQLAAQSASEVQQAEQKSSDKVSAQKAETEQKAAEEDALRKEIKREEARQQAELDRSNQERVAILAKSAQATFDISRRLVEIGAVKSTPSIGSILNSKI
jgi:hypothetical protein